MAPLVCGNFFFQPARAAALQPTSGRHTHPVVRPGFKPGRGCQTLPGRFDSCCFPPSAAQATGAWSCASSAMIAAQRSSKVLFFVACALGHEALRIRHGITASWQRFCGGGFVAAVLWRQFSWACLSAHLARFSRGTSALLARRTPSWLRSRNFIHPARNEHPYATTVSNTCHSAPPDLARPRWRLRLQDCPRGAQFAADPKQLAAAVARALAGWHGNGG